MNRTAFDHRLLYRVEEAAEALGCSRALVYQLINKGKLPHVRLSDSIRIPRSALEAWIANELHNQGADQRAQAVGGV